MQELSKLSDAFEKVGNDEYDAREKKRQAEDLAKKTK